MARTAPAPNIPPIPGMCPGIAVAGGGGDGGGGSGGSAKKGKGKKGAGKKKGKKDPKAGKKSGKKGKCGSQSEPVDVVTGRVFTFDTTDLALPGPRPFAFRRSYSSSSNRRDVGLGFGWVHTFSWEILVHRSSIEVWDDDGTPVMFDRIEVGQDVIGPEGWVLRREPWGFAVDAGDGLWHLFSATFDKGRSYRLTAVEDRNRNRTSLTYEDGRLVEAVDSVGRVIRFESDAQKRIRSITTKNAEVQGRRIEFARYEYDDQGDLRSATDADGFTTRYDYAPRHLLATHVDRAGLAWHYLYDDKERCVEAWGDYPGHRDPSLDEGLPTVLADGVTRVKGVHHCKFTYLPEELSEVATASNVIRYRGNDLGLVESEVNGPGVTSTVWDENGHRIAYTDEQGFTTLYDRDPRGRITRIVDALEHVTTFERDASGLIVKYVDPSGATTTIERDPRGNPRNVVYPNGAVATYRVDERGLPVEVILPNGGRVVASYDRHFNLVGLSLPNGAEYRWQYDYLGRRVAQRLPNGLETHWAWSDRGDLLSASSSEGLTRFTYDGEHRVTSRMSTTGATVHHVYGGYDVLCEQRDETDNRYSFRYDLEGQLRRIVDPRGDAWTFEYDGSGQCTHQRAFDGREYWFHYDVSGTLVGVEDSLGRRTTLTYDPVGNLVARELSDGTAETFEYDARGLMSKASDGTVTVAMERDVLGQVVKESVTLGDRTDAIERTFDESARVVSLRTSLGHERRLERDVLGFVRRMSDPSAPDLDLRFGRDFDGIEIARDFGSVSLRSERDPRGRLRRRRLVDRTAAASPTPGMPERVGLADPGAIFERSFAYDTDGNVAMTRGRRGADTYRHDPSGRLLDAILADGSLQASWEYDAAGNRRDRVTGSVYAPGNRLVERGNTRYRWDADGQLIEKVLLAGDRVTVDERTEYEWNGKGQLAAINKNDRLRLEFTYDPFWRRIEKRVFDLDAAGAPTLRDRIRFVWDGDRLVHEIHADAAQTTRTYCFEEHAKQQFVPLAQKVDGRWQHIITDQVGAPEAIVAADGRVLCELEREPLGRMRPADGATADTPLRLQGQFEDEESGLFYNRFRYYDPDNGTFISADPIGLTGGFDSFAYGNSPLSWVDPLGLTGLNTTIGDALENQRVAELKKNGWEVMDTKCGTNGIDILAVKRDEEGKISSMRVEECKANSSKLGDTKSGKQMSDNWIKNNMQRKQRRAKKQGCAKGEQDMKDAEAFFNDPKNAGKIDKVVVHGEVDSSSLAVSNITQANVTGSGTTANVGPFGAVTN